MSWSLSLSCDWISRNWLGRDVIIKSKVFFSLVGKWTNCSKWWSFKISMNFSPSDRLSGEPDLLSLSGQTMSHCYLILSCLVYLTLHYLILSSLNYAQNICIFFLNFFILGYKKSFIHHSFVHSYVHSLTICLSRYKNYRRNDSWAKGPTGETTYLIRVNRPTPKTRAKWPGFLPYPTIHYHTPTPPHATPPHPYHYHTLPHPNLPYPTPPSYPPLTLLHPTPPHPPHPYPYPTWQAFILKENFNLYGIIQLKQQVLLGYFTLWLLKGSVL